MKYINKTTTTGHESLRIRIVLQCELMSQ